MGMVILRVNGFWILVNLIFIVGGFVFVLVVFLGGIIIVLVLIIVVFCVGLDSYEDFDCCYVVGIVCGVFFCFGGVFVGIIVEVLVFLLMVFIVLLVGFVFL